MCGRVWLPTDFSEIKIRMKFDDQFAAPNFAPSWNIAPTQQMLTTVLDPLTKTRRPVTMRWGLIPSWAKDEKIGVSLFNARADTISEKPTFRGAWKAGRRCLIVTDGFYEWRKKSDKQPFAIARANNQLTVMAGLWEEWRSPAGETIKSCVVITTEANELIEPLHDRMPVILAEEDWPAWLGEVPASDAELKALLKPFPADRMKLWPVDRAVGNWRNNGPQLIEPVATREGKFMVAAVDAGEALAYVVGGEGLPKMIPESEYRAADIEPPFETLPTLDEYEAAEEAKGLPE
jgi:putative SOS response-associated peptidase YedK